MQAQQYPVQYTAPAMQPMYAAPMAPPSYGVPMQPMQAPIAMEMQAPGSIQPGQLLGPHNKVSRSHAPHFLDCGLIFAVDIPYAVGTAHRSALSE